MTLDIGHAFIHQVPFQLRLPDRKWRSPVTHASAHVVESETLRLGTRMMQWRRSQLQHGHWFRLQICGLQTVPLTDLSSM